ncbi:hypothetical protein GGI07_001975 [Coemansia sp. Benny D115]|nr:hypothetical protein GGI07_001975 [Coemansia sp. Benny D115]
MLSLTKQLLRPARALGTRNYAALAVYVSNLNSATTPETLRELFGKYGRIGGIRMNVNKYGAIYAHVYYGAGEAPLVNGEPYYMTSRNPTEEELESVKKSVEDAIRGQSDAVVDGNTLIVSPSTNKVKASPYYATNLDSQQQPQQQQQSQRQQRNDNNGFKRGFSEGYRQGYADAMKARAAKARLIRFSLGRHTVGSLARAATADRRGYTTSSGDKDSNESTEGCQKDQRKEEANAGSGVGDSGCRETAGSAFGFDSGFRDGYQAGFEQGRKYAHGLAKHTES